LFTSTRAALVSAGVSFADIVYAEDLISRFPAGAPEILPGIRRQLLRKFPCSLIFSNEGEYALILAVAHGRRRPMYWIHRL